MLDQPFRHAAALWVVLWLLAPTVAALGSPHYAVATDERLEHLDVSACFEGAVPRRLTARDERAPDLLRGAQLHIRDEVIELKLQGSKLSLPRTGAAIALLADVELRRRSGGAQSLDTALAAFGDCCLPACRLISGLFGG